MKYKKSIETIVTFFVFSLAALPATLFAATAYLTPASQSIYPGDVFVVEARISSSDEPINVVDASILFDKNKLTVKELSTGGSVFSLWAEQPSFSNSEGVIRFVGGAPNGVEKKKDLILKIVFRAVSEGKSTVAFSSDSVALLSDGKGTQTNLETEPVIISVAKRPPQTLPKDEWQGVTTRDTTPPQFIEAVISRDERVFDNQYFVNFFAVDKESGIAYYEIKEGDGDFIRAESPYLLVDQSQKGALHIKAVDTAGNESVIVPRTAGIPFVKYLVWLLALTVITALSFLVYRLWNARRKK